MQQKQLQQQQQSEVPARKQALHSCKSRITIPTSNAALTRRKVASSGEAAEKAAADMAVAAVAAALESMRPFALKHIKGTDETGSNEVLPTQCLFTTFRSRRARLKPLSFYWMKREARHPRGIVECSGRHVLWNLHRNSRVRYNST